MGSSPTAVVECIRFLGTPLIETSTCNACESSDRRIARNAEWIRPFESIELRGMDVGSNPILCNHVAHFKKETRTAHTVVL